MGYDELAPFAWQGRDKTWNTAGENSRVSTLTNEQVLAIKAYVRSPAHKSDATTGAVFGVTRSTIANIRTGRRWSHLRLPDSSLDSDS